MSNATGLTLQFYKSERPSAAQTTIGIARGLRGIQQGWPLAGSQVFSSRKDASNPRSSSLFSESAGLAFDGQRLWRSASRERTCRDYVRERPRSRAPVETRPLHLYMGPHQTNVECVRQGGRHLPKLRLAQHLSRGWMDRRGGGRCSGTFSLEANQ